MSNDASKPTTEYVEHATGDRGTPYLEIIKGAPVAAPARLSVGTIVLGRDDAADVAYPVDGVSRKHARLMIAADGDIRVVDLASRNGTYLNGRRVEEASLRDGDELRLGPVTLRVMFVGGTGNSATMRSEAPVAADLPLSARELEVAQLVAAGMTNAEIGAQLHISPATVGRHLSNVYERLGIHSRAALVSKLAGR